DELLFVRQVGGGENVVELPALFGRGRTFFSAELEEASLKDARVIGFSLGDHAKSGAYGFHTAHLRPRGKGLAAVFLRGPDLVDDANDGGTLGRVSPSDRFEPLILRA